MRTPRPERQSEPDAEHLDNMLDEALRETFPASDPIAITIDKPLIYRLRGTGPGLATDDV